MPFLVLLLIALLILEYCSWYVKAYLMLLAGMIAWFYIGRALMWMFGSFFAHMEEREASAWTRCGKPQYDCKFFRLEDTDCAAVLGPLVLLFGFGVTGGAILQPVFWKMECVAGWMKSSVKRLLGF